jgi:hypothetical protein
MEPSLKIGIFSKSLLAGLLSGVCAAVLNLVYSIIYRNATGFATAEIIMPLSIFIGFPILLAMAGCAYYLLQKHLRAGTSWFIFFCIALLAALVITTILDTKQNGGTLFSGLRGLCLGMEIITCLLAAGLIPYFARHPNIYE